MLQDLLTERSSTGSLYLLSCPGYKSEAISVFACIHHWLCYSFLGFLG